MAALAPAFANEHFKFEQIPVGSPFDLDHGLPRCNGKRYGVGIATTMYRSYVNRKQVSRIFEDQGDVGDVIARGGEKLLGYWLEWRSDDGRRNTRTGGVLGRLKHPR